MKKNLFLLLICVLICSMILTSCSLLKSRDVKNTEELIVSIGKVSLDSLNSIEAAESAYKLLSDKEKEKVENYNLLEEAREDYLFLFAKSIYDNISSAGIKLKDSMSLYYETWRFSIYGDSDDEVTVDGLADEVGLTADEVDYAIQQIAKDNDMDKLSKKVLDILYEDTFSVGLWILDEVFEYRGTLTDIEELLVGARSDLKLMEKQNPDYEYYKQLLEYYAKTNSYFGYASDVTGSFDTFKETRKDYEKKIEEIKTGLEFTFGD